MALTLTRKVGESLVIGNATVVVASVSGRAIKLKIVAPSEVKVVRSELLGNSEVNGHGETKGK